MGQSDLLWLDQLDLVSALEEHPSIRLGIEKTAAADREVGDDDNSFSRVKKRCSQVAARIGYDHGIVHHGRIVLNFTTNGRSFVNLHGYSGICVECAAVMIRPP